MSRNGMKESQTESPDDLIEDVLETEHNNLSNASNVNAIQHNFSHLHHSQHVYHREAVSASLLIIASWSTRVVFALPMMSTLLQPLMTMLQTIDFVHSQNYRGNVILSSSSPSTSIMTMHPVALSELLLIVNLLVQTQVHSSNDVGLTPMLNMMLLLPWQTWCSQLPFELGLRQSRYYDMYNSNNGMINNTSRSPTCHALFSLLLQHCCARITISQSFSSTPPEVVSFLLVASEYLPLSPHLVNMFIHTILSLRVDVNATKTINHDDDEGKAVNEEENEEREDDEDDEMSLFVSRVLGNLERRFQILFDRVLSSELLKESTSGRHAKEMVHHFFHGTKYTMVKINEPQGKHTFSSEEKKQKQLLQGHSSVQNSHMANKTAQVVSGSTELPLFACLLHPEPQIRELGAHALTAMTLEELFPINLNATSLKDISNNNILTKSDTQNINKQHAEQLENSLLGLLMHVSAYETNSTVALTFINAAAHALQLLISALSSCTTQKTTTTSAASSGTESELQIHNKNMMNANMKWIIGAVHGLLKSMYTMLSLQIDVHDAKHNEDTKDEMQNAFFTLCLMPYLQSHNEQSKNISHNTTTSAQDKATPQKQNKINNETRRKKQKQVHNAHEEENEEAALHLCTTQESLPREIKSVMVYYALLMYMNMHKDSSTTSTNISILANKIEQSLSDYGVALYQLIKLIYGKEVKLVRGNNNKQSNIDVDHNEAEEEEHGDEESVEIMQSDKHNSKKKSANCQIEEEAFNLTTFDEIFSHIAPVAQSRLPHLLKAVQGYINVDAVNANNNGDSKATHNNSAINVNDDTTENANHTKVDLTCRHAVWQECLLCLTVCLSATSSSSLEDDFTLLTLNTAELLTKFLLGPSASSIEVLSNTQAKSKNNNKI